MKIMFSLVKKNQQEIDLVLKDKEQEEYLKDHEIYLLLLLVFFLYSYI